jgi:RNA-binding protein
MEELRGKQRRFLRGQGNTIKPTVYLGKEGISEALLQSLNKAFNNQELVKVRIEKASDLERKEAAEKLAEAASAHLVQVLGNTLLLYRPDADEPRIKLPA